MPKTADSIPFMTSGETEAPNEMHDIAIETAIVTDRLSTVIDI